MTDDPRVQQLLEELHASESTPEAVCELCPELLPVVRKQWRRIRRLRADLDALFPSPNEPPPPPDGTNLPQVPGYEVEGVLGRGGMGIVFQARHLRLNRPVALKMVLAGAYADPLDRARFQREAEAAAGIRHPNIVQVYDVGESNGRPYFTMEYIEGGSLAKRLAGTPQLPQHAAQLLATLAGAVQAAHDKGIVHRDLKPANVLLTADGAPKISDFGLARRLEGEAGITRTGAAVGTPSYMAPEQARGGPDAVGPAADVYALGAILYELLIGRPPFRAATAAETVQQVLSQEPAPPSRLNDKVPRDLETICLKCLHKEPVRRYASAVAVANDLLRFQRREPILARRAGPVERLAKWTRRHRSLAAFLFSAFLLLGALVAGSTWVLLERAVLAREVGDDFELVVQAQKEQNWGEARTALERAKTRLGDNGPSELRRRAAQLDRELILVGTLEDILLSHLHPESPDVPARYEAALREAGLINGLEDPKVVAARIRATGIATRVLAALDDWAYDWTGEWASLDAGRLDWLLEVAQQVDENPASRAIRDAKLWNDEVALKKFAQSAPLSNQSVPFLKFLGVKLDRLGGDPMTYLTYLKRVQQAHLNSYMANSLLAHALHMRGYPAESLRYYQAAIALKPTDASIRCNFGKALTDLGKWDEALVEFEVARRLTPEMVIYTTNIGIVLNNMNRPAEAERELRRVLETHPTDAPCLTGLANSLFRQSRHAAAIETYRQAIAAEPKYVEAYRQLKECCLSLQRWEEGRIAWQQWLTCEDRVFVMAGSDRRKSSWHNWLQVNPYEGSAWDGYAELCLYLGNEAEYSRSRKELLKRFVKTTDPQVAERTGRTCLLLPASEDELKQATALIDRALAADTAKYGWAMPYFRFAKALAEYRAGNLESALTLLDGDVLRILGPTPRLLLAMVQHRLGKKDAARDSLRTATAAYDWDVKKATYREAWMYHLLRREAETVLASMP